jgi:hypothetical protein
MSASADAVLPAAATPRLVVAEILKLRKRLGLVVLTTVLTICAIVVTYGVLVILHAVNPKHHGDGVTNERLGWP